MKNTLDSLIKICAVIMIVLVLPASLSAQVNNQQNSKSNLKIFVQYRLAKSNLLKNDNIKVDIKNNKIILSGTVPTLFDKEEAGRQAQSVDENYAVENNISVENKSVSDSTLTKEIMKKIQANVFYGVFDWLTIKCNDGNVTLGGWVHYPWLKKQYETEVKKVPGVKSIVNNLKKTFGPGELGFRAAQIIYNDPMFWGMQYSFNPPIHIIVNNGVVLLYGKVDSENQKELASTLVNFHTNAITVENNLKVKS